MEYSRDFALVIVDADEGVIYADTVVASTVDGAKGRAEATFKKLREAAAYQLWSEGRKICEQPVRSGKH